MLLLTILFLTYYVVILIKGSLYHKLRVEIGEEEIRKQKEGVDNFKADTELGVKILLLSLIIIPFIIILLIYLSVGVGLDPYKYPTLALLILSIVSLPWGFMKNKKKVDLSTEDKIAKYRKKIEKKRTFKGTVTQIMWIVYFSYMFYFLVF